MQPTTSQPNPNQNNIGEIRFASLNPGELDQNFQTTEPSRHSSRLYPDACSTSKAMQVLYI